MLAMFHCWVCMSLEDDHCPYDAHVWIHPLSIALTLLRVTGELKPIPAVVLQEVGQIASLSQKWQHTFTSTGNLKAPITTDCGRKPEYSGNLRRHKKNKTMSESARCEPIAYLELSVCIFIVWQCQLQKSVVQDYTWTAAATVQYMNMQAC